MFDDGGLCTISPELVSAGFDFRTLPGGVILSGSDEHFDLWERGWCALIDALGVTGRLAKLRVNRVYWSTQTTDGQNFLPAYSKERIDKANQFLDRLYERIARDISAGQWLPFDKDVFVGSPSHRWGELPLVPSDQCLGYALYLFECGARKKVFWYQPVPNELATADVPIDAIQAFIRDEFNEIGTGYQSVESEKMEVNLAP